MPNGAGPSPQHRAATPAARSCCWGCSPPGKRAALIYPLVNVNKTLWKSPCDFHGKIHYFDWAMFNSKLLVYQRVCVYSLSGLHPAWFRNISEGCLTLEIDLQLQCAKVIVRADRTLNVILQKCTVLFDLLNQYIWLLYIIYISYIYIYQQY